MTKNERIKQTLLETSERRLNQVCKTFVIKFDYSHLSNKKLNYLNSLFVEAKWIYNFCLNQDDVFKISDKIKTVKVLNKDNVFEERGIKFLSSQMKQAIIDKTKTNIVNLSKAKKKGLKVGKLKFKSDYKCIPLKQSNVTYKIKGKSHIKLQGFKGIFKVNGLSQIKEGYELANANLIKKNNNFYLMVTCYKDKETKAIKDNQIGIDVGIKDDFTFSNGIKINTDFDYSNIKKEQRELSKKQKGGKNYYKQKNKLNKKYEKLDRIKRDNRNKIVSYLKNNFNLIAIQDENIKAWHHGWFGKSVQTSILGITLSELKKHDKTIIVDKWFPTTKACYNCGKINKIKLSDRVFKCSCGLIEDRDVKSAKTILKVAMGHSDIKPVEKQTSEAMLNYFNNNLSYTSVKQEAKCFSFW